MKLLVLGGKSCIFKSVRLTNTAIIVSVENEGYLEAVCVAKFINTQQL